MSDAAKQIWQHGNMPIKIM